MQLTDFTSFEATNKVKSDGYVTRYASLCPWQARTILLLILLAINWSFVRSVNLPDFKRGDLELELSDYPFYQDVVSRVGDGENYYAAANSELRSWGFKRRSLFYWRLPTYAWVMGRGLTTARARVALAVGMAVGIVMSFVVLRSEGGWSVAVLASLLLLAGWGSWLARPEPIYYTELWASVALFLATCMQSMRFWPGAVLTAAVALAFRELALPFCALWCVVAWIRRRWKEAVCWSLVIIAFLVSYYMHCRLVHRFNSEVTVLYDTGWMRLGGIGFVCSCCRMNYLLATSPPWCTAVYLPLALLGLFGWNSQRAIPFQAAVTCYFVLFYFVGKSFDSYWGWFLTPGMSVGAAWSPLAIRDLAFRSAPWPSADPTAVPPEKSLESLSNPFLRMIRLR
jgi:hypothetical protein